MNEKVCISQSLATPNKPSNSVAAIDTQQHQHHRCNNSRHSQRGQSQQQQPPTLPPIDEKHGDPGIHGFWERGRLLCIFNFRVTDTDAHSYQHKDQMKVLADQEKEKEDKYLVRCCHELCKDFTPVVYSVNGMSWREARMAENRMASYLSKKWHQPYS